MLRLLGIPMSPAILVVIGLIMIVAGVLLHTIVLPLIGVTVLIRAPFGGKNGRGTRTRTRRNQDDWR
jgi:hypothetical protein